MESRNVLFKSHSHHPSSPSNPKKPCPGDADINIRTKSVMGAGKEHRGWVRYRVLVSVLLLTSSTALTQSLNTSASPFPHLYNTILRLYNPKVPVSKVDCYWTQAYETSLFCAYVVNKIRVLFTKPPLCARHGPRQLIHWTISNIHNNLKVKASLHKIIKPTQNSCTTCLEWYNQEVAEPGF